ncbi:MAG: ribonuclease HI [Lachnospiraceae bacterium]|nr:ribonuclease HI [Lachnospiraceae bacterium]
MADKVTLYSDGSAKGNPGPGGYGVVLQYTDAKGVLHEKELSAGYSNTTNNRMELMGVIKGFEALKHPCDVKVVSDSKYVVDAFNQHWVDYWVTHNFRKADHKPVKNDDLWKRLLEVMKIHHVSFEWVKGHDGHPENERCDTLAQNAADGENLLTDEGVKGE